VFWQDFERWRLTQTGLDISEEAMSRSDTQRQSPSEIARSNLPPQAARIVAEFG